MITAAYEVRPGYIRGTVSTRTLRRVLSGDETLEGTLTDGGCKPAQNIPYSHPAPGTLVGFLPGPEHPCEIVVARLPFTRQMVPVISLSVADRDWEAEPQFFSRKYLLRFDGVALKADWLDFLINLAGTLENPNTRAIGVDRTLLTIGTAWERWENNTMTWPDRCKDLARLTGLSELKANTLERKCERLGLERRDKKAS